MRRRGVGGPCWLLAAAVAAAGGCEEEPAPRFEAPLASGVVAVPVDQAARFDRRIGQEELLDALARSGHEHLAFEALDDEASLIVAHLPRSRFSAAILGQGVVAVEALAGDGHALVLGSGFVNVFNPVLPLGLLQLDGEVKTEPTRHGYTRIVGVRAGELGIIGRDEYHPGLFESAIQVGPGIVQLGKLDILQRERQLPAHIRAVVAACEDRWLAAVAQSPSHLYDLGERLIGYFEANSLRCEEVANLSGDREALLAVSSADGSRIAYFGNPTLPKASIIAFRVRT